jgi:DUF1680 family protein
LSSPALDGKHFFYVNPLMLRDAASMRKSANPTEKIEKPGRPEWHSVSCCPPNVMRLFASLAHYLTTTDQTGIQIHQYTPAEFHLPFGDERQAALRMETEYPWDGRVQLQILESDGRPWQLRLRIPGWCTSPRLIQNGEEILNPEIEKGYFKLDRSWKPGDTVLFEIRMSPELVEPNPRIDAVRNSLAVQRGPLIYCLEAADNSGVNLMDVQIEEKSPLQAAWREDVLPEAMVVLQAEGCVRDATGWQGQIYRPLCRDGEQRPASVSLLAIPYYAWANREVGSMRVWIPRSE